MDVSDRRMQVQLTQEAKIATDFFFIGAIFAFVDFLSALTAGQNRRFFIHNLWTSIVDTLRKKNA